MEVVLQVAIQDPSIPAQGGLQVIIFWIWCVMYFLDVDFSLIIVDSEESIKQIDFLIVIW